MSEGFHVPIQGDSLPLIHLGTPVKFENLVVNEGKNGNWSDCRVLSLSFFRKPKREIVSSFKLAREWAAQAHREIFVLCKLPFGAGGNIHSASNQNFRKVLAFVGSCRPHWQFLSCEKKGTKDSQGTCWFLDLQQKGAMPPLDTPAENRALRDSQGQ